MNINELIRKEALRRGLRPKTIKTYQRCVEVFFRRCSKDPLQVRSDDIRLFLDHLLEKGSPGNTLNVYLNALKFFYQEVLHRKLTVKIRYSKVRRRLPDFLTKEETISLISAIENHKHSLLIRLLYSSGLRIGELLNLKVKDLNLSEGYGWVRNGKGGKDRPFIIAHSLKEELRSYLQDKNPESWLFLGWNRSPYDSSSVREILKKASRKAGLSKKAYPHMLRHSFATHLIQNGYSPLEVQPLLGHNDVNTTMIYLHLAAANLLNVRSPLDGLEN
jgi:site-specific recombinase XerD